MPRTHKTFPRLFVTEPLAAGAAVTLGRDQANYLAAVLRKAVGDAVILFNGRDGAWLAKLTAVDKRSVMLDCVVQTAHQTLPSDLWYGFAPLKSARLDYVVQKATEMGAGVIQPVITQYTQVSRLKTEKLAANVMEAAEQCEVLSVPQLAPETSLKALLDGWQATQGLRRLVVCDEAAASASPLRALRELEGLPIGLLVGPEGGFSDAERTQLLEQPYVVAISLGPRILRADTAAVAALAVVQASIGDWR